MLPQDKLIAQVTIARNKRAELISVAEQHPGLFSELQIITPEAPPYPHRSIFINYRREDSENVVGRIYDRLALEFGKGSVFKDVEDILPGVDFRRVLEHEVASTDVMLVVIGPDWINRKNRGRLQHADDFVRLEIETALKRGHPGHSGAGAAADTVATAPPPAREPARSGLSECRACPARSRFSPRYGSADSGDCDIV